MDLPDRRVAERLALVRPAPLVALVRVGSSVVDVSLTRRTVPLDGWLADDVRAYVSTHPREHEPTAPLFPAQYGRAALGVARSTPTVENPATLDSYNWKVPLEPGTFYANYFRAALRAEGLPTSGRGPRGVRWHDLRHTFAVLSLTAGAHYMSVSKWLGHESYVTTLTIYADCIDQEEGGKAAPLARPVAPVTPTPPSGNVVQFRRRTGS